jgi:subtilase family serine protease
MPKGLPFDWQQAIAVCAAAVLSASGMIALRAQGPLDRVTVPVDDSLLTTAVGNVHPLASPQYDRGEVSAPTRLEKMVLVLKTSPAQQEGLNDLTQAQQTPGTPEFHRWLTAEEFGNRFGLSSHDLAAITGWLSRHGFSIDEVAPDRLLVIFSGTAGQVADTFHTELHQYAIPAVNARQSGQIEMHIANVQDPQIPAAFAGVVEGVLSLHDFRRAPTVQSRPLAANIDYTDAARHSLTPAEFAMLYDLPPLYASGDTGAGAAIAIVSRSNLAQHDLDRFRALNGLAFHAPFVTFISRDPGVVPGDEDEAILDSEWSGAVAPGAAIHTVVADSTATTDGVDLAAQYIVNHIPAQIVDVGFASCEDEMGAAEIAFYGNLWQQAAAEGISALVASGNRGAASCSSLHPSGIPTASVNGLCSSLYSTCIGGHSVRPTFDCLNATAGARWFRFRSGPGGIG